MSKIKFGVNVNTRVPLIYPHSYSAERILDLAQKAEESGYDSLWVGDSILTKPRLDPIVVLSALAFKTNRVKLGTACIIAPLRNPVLFARSWATLDLLSNGRMLMGICIGPDTLEYDKLGISHGNRGKMVEEYVQVLHRLWNEDDTSFSGSYYKIHNVTVNPKPVQKPHPPIYIVGWPYGHGNGRGSNSSINTGKLANSILSRVSRLGEGWMFDGFATPEGVEDGVSRLKKESTLQFEVVYQMTLNLSSSKNDSEQQAKDYLLKYYGNLSRPLDSWGPFGSQRDCIEWIERFGSAGITTIILRFASPSQFEQLDRFTKDVLPSF